MLNDLGTCVDIFFSFPKLMFPKISFKKKNKPKTKTTKTIDKKCFFWKLFFVLNNCAQMIVSCYEVNKYSSQHYTQSIFPN